jgi:hypothetical protein
MNEAVAEKKVQLQLSGQSGERRRNTWKQDFNTKDTKKNKATKGTKKWRVARWPRERGLWRCLR